MLLKVILLSILCLPLASSSAVSLTTEGSLEPVVEETTLDSSDTTTLSSNDRTDGELLENPMNDPPFSHLRKSEMGIPVGEAKEPPLCPPPSVTRSLGICYLRKCSSHHDCSSDRACCFNGCIHTCTDPMDRPAAFDWVEDTSKILPILDVDFDESPKPFTPIRLQNQSTEYAAAVAGEELVHLPGGCLVTATRYMKLKEFMKAPSIEQCRCNDGEVVCDVRANRS